MSKCGSCEYKRKKYLVDGHKYNCRKSGAFCKLTDTTLIDLYQRQYNAGPLTLEVHRQLSLSVNDGHQAALRLARATNVSFERADDLLHEAVRLHKVIFGQTGLAFAGQFRKTGDPPVVFGVGANQRSGVAPESIQSQLIELHQATVGQEGIRLDHRGPLIRCCARFLEEFFMIHPFHDGNGRVARLLLRIIADRSNVYSFGAFPESPKARRKYNDALEYAHRHCHTGPSTAASAATVRDPYIYIAEWLDACLLEHVDEPDAFEDRQPDWLEYDREDYDREDDWEDDAE